MEKLSSLNQSKISKKTGIGENELLEELKRRMAIIHWLQERNITDYQTVSQVISLYYSYPEIIISFINF